MERFLGCTVPSGGPRHLAVDEVDVVDGDTSVKHPGFVLLKTNLRKSNEISVQSSVIAIAVASSGCGRRYTPQVQW